MGKSENRIIHSAAPPPGSKVWLPASWDNSRRKRQEERHPHHLPDLAVIHHGGQLAEEIDFGIEEIRAGQFFQKLADGFNIFGKGHTEREPQQRAQNPD